MWLSRQMRAPAETAGAELGVTSISGGQAGVVTRGEARRLPVYGPGGYMWQPEAGGTVLVIKGGTGGEETCVAGTKQTQTPDGFQPGEVYIHAGGGGVYLKNDGTVEVRGGRISLCGAVSIQGELVVNGEPYSPCRC